MAVGGKFKFEVDDGTSIGQREMCEMCNKTEHDGYCSQCEIHVCQICFDNHRKSKLCRDHLLLQNADKNKRQNSGIRFDTCSEHEQQEVRFYCTEHKCFGCSECILVRHNSCKWEYIVEASNRFQDSGDLARLLEDVQSLAYTLDKYMEAINEHTSSAETIDKDAVLDIETFAKSLVEYIARSKQQALDDAKERDSAHQQKLDKLKLDIQSLDSQVEEIITDFRDEDIIHKRFILAVKTMPKLARIQNDVAAIDCNNVITGYTFRPGNFLKRMMSNTRPIGRLTGASQTGEVEEDDEYIKLKKEREISQGLDHQLKENQKMMSTLKKDLHDMEQTYGKVVKDKKCLEQDICTLKSENQNVVSKLNKDNSDMKKNYDTIVKDKHSIEQELTTLKQTHGRTVSKLKQELGDMKLNQERVVKDKQSLTEEVCALKDTNQRTVSKLKQELGDMKLNQERVVKDKQSLTEEVCALKDTNQRTVSKLKQELGDMKLNQERVAKDKQSLTEEVCALKDTNQKVVNDKTCLEKELCTLKSENQRAIKEIQSMELQIDEQKSSNQGIISKMKQDLEYVKQHAPAVTLSCGHENIVLYFGKERLLKCRTCGIINGDQPNGTLKTYDKGGYTELIFTFPKGTQSKLNRNPGQPYSRKTVTAFLDNNREGKLILKMMNIAIERKSMFTIDNHGNINTDVELFTSISSLL